MRIVSGVFRGRKLSPSKLKFTRPTTDFAREGLFNVLNSRIELAGLDVLDLYSGSGAVALEFLSRGAASAVAVDNSVESVKFISEIKMKWKIGNLDVVKSDVGRYLEGCMFDFDLVFADPPFDSGHHAEVISLISGGSVLRKDGWLIMEHSRDSSLELLPGFEFQKSYGSINFSIFRKKEH